MLGVGLFELPVRPGFSSDLLAERVPSAAVVVVLLVESVAVDPAVLGVSAVDPACPAVLGASGEVL